MYGAQCCAVVDKKSSDREKQKDDIATASKFSLMQFIYTSKNVLLIDSIFRKCVMFLNHECQSTVYHRQKNFHNGSKNKNKVPLFQVHDLLVCFIVSNAKAVINAVLVCKRLHLSLAIYQ